LDFLWTDTLSNVQSHAPVRLSPSWRLMLMGDCSPTRNLQLLVEGEISVDLLSMQPVGRSQLPSLSNSNELASPLLRRQILKHHGRQTLMWAESFWNQQTAQEHLHEQTQSIFHNLRRDRVELLREIDVLGQVQDKWLQEYFGQKPPFWYRLYRLFKAGQVLTVIQEVYSPVVESYF